MTSKNETPIEVILEKSSSGTWTVPEAPKRQFKPWQRLWLTSGLIYLLILAGSFYMLMPNQESIERQRVMSAMEEVKRYDGMAFADETPKKIYEVSRSLGYDKWIGYVRSEYHIGPEGNAGFNWVDKVYRDALSDLPAKRKLGVMISIVAWLIPMSALYAMGLVVDWIKRRARAIKER